MELGRAPPSLTGADWHRRALSGVVDEHDGDGMVTLEFRAGRRAVGRPRRWYSHRCDAGRQRIQDEQARLQPVDNLIYAVGLEIET